MKYGPCVPAGFACLMGGLLLFSSCFQDSPRTAPEDGAGSIRIAVPLQPSSALALLATYGGFFEQVTPAPVFSLHASGKRAIEEALLSGTADIAFSSDLPVIEQLRQGEDLVIVATVQTVRSVNAVVARRDHGVNSIEDLAGKRVGVQGASAVHYFLHNVLQAHGVAHGEVEQVFLPIDRLPAALAAGELDAISIREPYLTEVADALGERVVVLDAPWVYPQFELLVSTRSFAEQHPRKLRRVLRALLAAERFLYLHAEEAEALLAAALQIPGPKAAEILTNTINRVELPQSMITVFEAQLDWLSAEFHQPEGGHVPSGQQVAWNLLDTVFSEPLCEVEPERVDIPGLVVCGRLQ